MSSLLLSLSRGAGRGGMCPLIVITKGSKGRGDVSSAVVITKGNRERGNVNVYKKIHSKNCTNSPP